MADSTTERLMDFVLLLLNSTAPLTINQIRERVPGYGQSNPESFKRMFERDKEALRDANIPLETVTGETGEAYFLSRKDWLLPDLRLTQRERMLIAFAATGWQNHHLAQTARDAARQIGGRVLQANSRNQLRLGFDQRNLAEVLEALRLHKSMSFQYASKSRNETSSRTIDPWQAVCRAGAWYVIGFDHDQEEMRTFRISRIVGNVEISDDDITTGPDDDFSLENALEFWTKQVQEPVQVTITVKPGTCAHLSVIADRVDVGETSDVIAVSTENIYGIARDIAASCGDVLKVEPQSVADRVTALVTSALEVNSA